MKFSRWWLVMMVLCLLASGWLLNFKLEQWREKLIVLTEAQMTDLVTQSLSESRANDWRVGDIWVRRYKTDRTGLLWGVIGSYLTHSGVYCGEGELIEAKGWENDQDEEIRVISWAESDWQEEKMEEWQIWRGEASAGAKLCARMRQIATDETNGFGFSSSHKKYSCAGLIMIALDGEDNKAYDWLTPDGLVQQLSKRGYRIVSYFN